MPAEPGVFSARLREGPLDDEAGTGRRILERVCADLKALASSEASAPQPDLSPEVSNFLSGVFAGSSFLHGLAERFPRLLAHTLDTPPEAHFEAILSRTAREASEAQSQRDIMRILREGKTEVSFLIALADLGGIWGVEEVTRLFSEAADVFVGAAVRFLLRRTAEAGQFAPREPSTSRSA